MFERSTTTTGFGLLSPTCRKYSVHDRSAACVSVLHGEILFIIKYHHFTGSEIKSFGCSPQLSSLVATTIGSISTCHGSASPMRAASCMQYNHGLHLHHVRRDDQWCRVNLLCLRSLSKRVGNTEWDGLCPPLPPIIFFGKSWLNHICRADVPACIIRHRITPVNVELPPLWNECRFGAHIRLIPCMGIHGLYRFIRIFLPVWAHIGKAISFSLLTN